jgi:hypothetical protein
MPLQDYVGPQRLQEGVVIGLGRECRLGYTDLAVRGTSRVDTLRIAYCLLLRPCRFLVKRRLQIRDIRCPFASGITLQDERVLAVTSAD